MKLDQKIDCLQDYLTLEPKNHRDRFKDDIYMFFNEDFTAKNTQFEFLNTFNSKSEIIEWVDDLTSQIVLKFDEDYEQINDFIFEYI